MHTPCKCTLSDRETLEALGVRDPDGITADERLPECDA